MKGFLFCFIVFTSQITIVANPYNDRYLLEKKIDDYLKRIEVMNLIPRRSPPFKGTSLILSTKKKEESQKREDYIVQIRLQLNPTLYSNGKDYLDKRISIDHLKNVPQDFKAAINSILEKDLYRGLNIEHPTPGILRYFQVISYVEIIKQVAHNASSEDLKDYLENYIPAIRSLSGRNESFLYIPFYHHISIEDFDKTTLELFDSRLSRFTKDVDWMISNDTLTKAQSLKLENMIKCFTNYSRDQRKLIDLDFYAGFFSDYGMDLGSQLSKQEYPHQWTYLLDQRIEVLYSDCLRVKELPIETLKWSYIITN